MMVRCILVVCLLVACGGADHTCPPNTKEKLITPVPPATGPMMRLCEDSDGKPNGPAIEIDESGRKRVVGRYVHGVRDGVWRYRHDVVGTTVEVQYRNGKLDGKLVARRTDGQVDHEREYRGGVPHGTSRFWAGDGSLITIEHHDRGKPAGIWEWFAADGTVEKRRVYGEDGVLLAVDGRPVPPPPQELELPEGSILERSECVRRAERTERSFEEMDRGCLHLFEQFQLCADDACRREVVEQAARQR